MDQREVGEEIDQLYEMSARESGMFAERVDELSSKTNTRDLFDVNACKKCVVLATAPLSSTNLAAECC